MLSLRSRRKHKAWGVSPRNNVGRFDEPAKRPAAHGSESVARFAGSFSFVEFSWGLRPRFYAYACFAGSHSFLQRHASHLDLIAH